MLLSTYQPSMATTTDKIFWRQALVDRKVDLGRREEVGDGTKCSSGVGWELEIGTCEVVRGR